MVLSLLLFFFGGLQTDLDFAGMSGSRRTLPKGYYRGLLLIRWNGCLHIQKHFGDPFPVVSLFLDWCRWSSGFEAKVKVHHHNVVIRIIMPKQPGLHTLPCMSRTPIELERLSRVMYKIKALYFVLTRSCSGMPYAYHTPVASYCSRLDCPSQSS